MKDYTNYELAQVYYQVGDRECQFTLQEMAPITDEVVLENIKSQSSYVKGSVRWVLLSGQRAEKNPSIHFIKE